MVPVPIKISGNPSKLNFAQVKLPLQPAPPAEPGSSNARTGQTPADANGLPFQAGLIAGRCAIGSTQAKARPRRHDRPCANEVALHCGSGPGVGGAERRSPKTNAAAISGGPRLDQTRIQTSKAYPGSLGKITAETQDLPDGCNYCQRQPISVAEIAEALGFHPNYLMRLFRRVSGMTLLEYIAQQRVALAQRLLATISLKVIDVAMESGFGSVCRFHTVFARLCGTTPRQYRACLRESNASARKRNVLLGLTTPL